MKWVISASLCENKLSRTNDRMGKMEKKIELGRRNKESMKLKGGKKGREEGKNQGRKVGKKEGGKEEEEGRKEKRNEGAKEGRGKERKKEKEAACSGTIFAQPVLFPLLTRLFRLSLGLSALFLESRKVLAHSWTFYWLPLFT